MGCSASTGIVKQIQNEKEIKPNHPLGFTPHQKRIVRRTWSRLTGELTQNGIRVFHKIFDIKPELKELFPFRKLEGEELINCHVFQGHASRFMQAVGAVVDNLDDPDTALSPLLLDLGRNHVSFEGFEPAYWDVFREALTHVWKEQLRHRFTPEANEAWQSVFMFIQYKLKEGYASSVPHTKNSV